MMDAYAHKNPFSSNNKCYHEFVNDRRNQSGSLWSQQLGRACGGRGIAPDGEERFGRAFVPLLRVASGERTKSEEFDFGSSEFAPCIIGATV